MFGETANRALIIACIAAWTANAVHARTLEGRVNQVRDADTIVVAGTPVRLNGVDAPEVSNQYGRDAARFMQRLVSGRMVVCDLNGERTYDRWVGVCYLNETDIGEVLIRSGYALDCARYSGGRYRPIEPTSARERLPQARYC